MWVSKRPLRYDITDIEGRELSTILRALEMYREHVHGKEIPNSGSITQMLIERIKSGTGK